MPLLASMRYLPHLNAIKPADKHCAAQCVQVHDEG